MSTVTNVILTLSLDESDNRLGEINAYFDGEEHGRYGAFVDASAAYNASTTGMVMEATVLVGAFNCLDIDEFVGHLLKNVRFRSLSDLRIFVQFQNDESFHLLRPCDGG